MNRYMDDMQYDLENRTLEEIWHKFEQDRIRWHREEETRKLTGARQPWNEEQIELESCFLYTRMLHLEGQEVPIQILRERAGMNEERDAQRMKEMYEEQQAKRQRDLKRAEQHRQRAEAKEQKDEAENQRMQQTETWRFMEQRHEQLRAAQKRAQDDQELEERTKLMKKLDLDENKVQAEKYRFEKQRVKLPPALGEFEIRMIEKDIGGFRDNINAQNEDWNTALHLAARGTDFYTAEKLIAAGASRRIFNNRGQAPSDLATGYQDLRDFLKLEQ